MIIFIVKDLEWAKRYTLDVSVTEDHGYMLNVGGPLLWAGFLNLVKRDKGEILHTAGTLFTVSHYSKMCACSLMLLLPQTQATSIIILSSPNWTVPWNQKEKLNLSCLQLLLVSYLDVNLNFVICQHYNLYWYYSFYISVIYMHAYICLYVHIYIYIDAKINE